MYYQAKNTIYLYVLLLGLSFAQLLYNMGVNGNFSNSISEQAKLDASDQNTIYKKADQYRKNNYDLLYIPYKYKLSTILIVCAEDLSNTTNIILPFVKWCGYVLCVMFFLGSISSFSSMLANRLFCGYLLLHPLINSWHPLLLRDDLVVAFSLVVIGFLAKLLASIKNNKPKIISLAGIVLFLAMVLMLRPELSAVLALFAIFSIFIYLRKIKKILFAIIVGLAGIYFYSDILQFYAFGLRDVKGSIANILITIRTFHFSPAPWNIIAIASKEINSDTFNAWLWFYLSFPISFITLITWFLFVLTKKIKVELFSIKSIIFLLLPVFIDFSYGYTSGSTVALGPRQGALSSLLLFYFFFVPTIITLLRMSLRSGVSGKTLLRLKYNNRIDQKV